MTEVRPPGYRGRIAIVLASLASIALLVAILIMLVSISRNGLNIRLSGDINLSDVSDTLTVELTMDEAIVLAMPQPVQMFTTGPDGEAIPAALSLATCPTCGGSMLPSKWNPWSGQIEWTCPACDEIDTP
ncbi:hypothetical protein ACFLSG_04125 [Candidatus Bipolaricaulota bacterium]